MTDTSPHVYFCRMSTKLRTYSEIPDDRIASAIRAGQGVLDAAARVLGIPRYAVERRVARSTELAQLMRDYKESMLDRAELELRNLVNQGDFPSIKLVLERQGASRGWGRAPVDVDLTLRGVSDPKRDQRIANLPEHVLTSMALAIGADGLVDGDYAPDESTPNPSQELDGEDALEEQPIEVPPPEQLSLMRDAAMQCFEPAPPIVDFNQPAPPSSPEPKRNGPSIDDLLRDFDFDADIDQGMVLGESP